MQMKRFNSESYNAVATFLLFNVSLSLQPLFREVIVSFFYLHCFFNLTSLVFVRFCSCCVLFLREHEKNSNDKFLKFIK